MSDEKPSEGYYSREEFAQRHFKDRHGNPWTVRDYQRESLEWKGPRKVHCDGRDVGKTAEIEIVTCWAALNRPHSEMLIATQTENHLYPLMNRLVQRFESIPPLADRVDKIRRSPSWHVTFKNGFVLWGRISGPRGVNFQGMHVDWVVVDEAQEMTDAAWGELHQALNADGWRWVYGVPNGLRNGFYRLTQMGAPVQQFNWPSSINPEWSPEKDDELSLLYGGRTSAGYIQRVLGLHGEPMNAVFSLDDYAACVDAGVPFHEIRIGENDVFDDLPSFPRGNYYLGCDLGYRRDPSEFVVYRDDRGIITNVTRLHLEGVRYSMQREIIELLDHAFDFRAIGIDNGGPGIGVAQALMELGESWCEKIKPFDFGSSIDLPPMADGTVIRRRIKEHMTEILRAHMARRTIVFPALADRESQYAGHTYQESTFGRILYNKGNDHLIDADRCAVLAHFLDTKMEAAQVIHVHGAPVLFF